MQVHSDKRLQLGKGKPEYKVRKERFRLKKMGLSLRCLILQAWSVQDTRSIHSTRLVSLSSSFHHEFSTHWFGCPKYQSSLDTHRSSFGSIHGLFDWG